ncbi:MAG: phosphomannose isomerase type II C-terminal cupin domain [Acidobacteria bacterium]|nr:phosphomannose isomerase type II C-terminal cupin domain [Acidobacteriota bacterium]
MEFDERPWGNYQVLDEGDGYKVKRLVVHPGSRLSLQRHARRGEHWVVIRGTARVTRNDDVFDLEPGESTDIPLGAIHRIENPGSDPLVIVEVQNGDYLGEDDIERIADDFGRVADPPYDDRNRS